MAIPIPRITWGDGYTVTAGENDLVVIQADPVSARHWYTGTVAAAVYDTPETLLAAFDAAAMAATDYAGTAYSVSNGIASTAANGTVRVAFTSSAEVALHFGDIIGWAAATAYAVGDFVGAGDRLYVCTTAGTSDATAPEGESDPVTDGTAQWSYRGTVAAMEGLADLLGFPLSDSNGGAEGITTADAPLPGVWSPDVPVRADVEREFESIVSQVETAGGQNKATRWTPSTDPLGGRRTYRRVRFSYLSPERTFAAESDTTTALETFWLSDGIGRFTYSPDRDNPTTDAAEYFLREQSAREFKPSRLSPSVELYDIELEMGLFTE